MNKKEVGLPSKIQQETIRSLDKLQKKLNRLVTSEEVRVELNPDMTKRAIDGRLWDYTRRGWLEKVERANVNDIPKYGVTQAWRDIQARIDRGELTKKVKETPWFSWCNQCGRKDRLTLYKGRYLCGKCLNPEYGFKAGDDNHLLVKSVRTTDG